MELNNLLKHTKNNLFAILDTAISSDMLSELRTEKITYVSLFEEKTGDLLQDVVPYLIQCPQESKFTKWLISTGWKQNWGIFFVSESSIEELRQHFRHFLLTEDEDGIQYYFRFYDPRVLRVFLPTCNKNEVKQFFGHVKQFFIEGKKQNEILIFMLAPDGDTVLIKSLDTEIVSNR
ncbi:MAG: DUF4123 domain-containing protein [Candidatus Desantisbacteria bacterium]